MDFLKDLSIKHLALLVAIIATIFYKKYSFGKAKYFLWSLWLIAITEFSYATLYKLSDGLINPRLIGNSYTILQFSFYILWYRSLMVNSKRKHFFLGSFVFFLIFAMIDSIFFQDIKVDNQTYIYAIGVLVVTVCIFSFFIEFLRSEQIVEFDRSIIFWFSLGILLFHVPYLPFRIAAEFFGFKSNPLYGNVVVVLNIIMHLCFLIGILWSKKKYNY